jgi:hypothetical protein
MIAPRMYPRFWFLGSGQKRFSYLTFVVLIHIYLANSSGYHTNCLRTSSAKDLRVFRLNRYCLILDNLLHRAGIGIPEDPALLVGAAILTNSPFTKAILSIGLFYLGYRECITLALWSSCAHMTGLAFVSNAIIYFS